MVPRRRYLAQIVVRDKIYWEKLVRNTLNCQIWMKFQFCGQNFYICPINEKLRLARRRPVYYSSSSISGRYMLYESCHEATGNSPWWSLNSPGHFGSKNSQIWENRNFHVEWIIHLENCDFHKIFAPTQLPQKMVPRTRYLAQIVVRDKIYWEKLVRNTLNCQIWMKFQFCGQNFYICPINEKLRLARRRPVYYSSSSISGRYMLYESCHEATGNSPWWSLNSPGHFGSKNSQIWENRNFHVEWIIHLENCHFE